jgi:hypothetical protein
MAPPIEHKILDWCDGCGDKIQRYKLTLTSLEYTIPKGMNLATYSSYNSDVWGCTAADAGLISLHKYRTRVRVAPSTNTPSIHDGTQTWSGNGTFRSTLGTDVSSYTDVTFSANVGAHQNNSSPSMTITMGVCDVDGHVLSTDKVWHTNGEDRTVWFTKKVSALSFPASCYYYITVVNAGKWFVDDMRIEGNVTYPSQTEFKKTSGAVANFTEDSRGYALVKLCPKCKMDKQRYGFPKVRYTI